MLVALRSNPTRDWAASVLQVAGHDASIVQPNRALDILGRLFNLDASPGVLVIDVDDYPATGPMLPQLQLANVRIPTLGFTSSQFIGVRDGVTVTLEQGPRHTGNARVTLSWVKL